MRSFLQGLLAVLQWKAFASCCWRRLGFWSAPARPRRPTTSAHAALHLHHAAGRGFAFLLGMHAVVGPPATSPSICSGCPRITTAAIILDGHAMAKNGEAGRALGAALASSLIGALIARSRWRSPCRSCGRCADRSARRDVHAAVVGLAFIASLSTQGVRGMVRGFLAGGVGLFLALARARIRRPACALHVRHALPVGGLDLVPVLVGLFAIPRSSTSCCAALRSPETGRSEMSGKALCKA